MTRTEKYPAEALTPDEVKIVKRALETGGSVAAVNGSQAVRDALCPPEGDSEMDDEDCTSGGDFIFAVNGTREIRDKLTGFVEEISGEDGIKV